MTDLPKEAVEAATRVLCSHETREEVEAACQYCAETAEQMLTAAPPHLTPTPLPGWDEAVEASDKIICEEWQQAVKEFELRPGSQVEKVISSCLNRVRALKRTPPIEGEASR